MFDQLAAFDATAVLGSGDRNQARHHDMVVGNTSLTTRQTRVLSARKETPAVGERGGLGLCSATADESR
jgi:hypothetical protein